MGCTTFQVGSPDSLDAFRITNQLPVDFLESYVQTVHTAERDKPSDFCRSLLLGEMRRGNGFWFPNAALPKST
jgi:hypothetical protein